MSPDLTIDVRRVAFRYYTWRIQIGTKTHMGHGSKTAARLAIQQFLEANGGKAVTW